MPIEQFFGRAEEQAQLADDSGRWSAWTAACPTLQQVGTATALVAVAHDRTQPARANELLLALVQAGSVDGGVDEAAATLVASILAPGGNRIIRSLATLGPDIADVVGGQLWLQVREYRWRDKPRAVAKNILMDTRRAVLADYGATTYRRAALVPIPSPDEEATGDHALERSVFEQQVPDLALLHLLVWATAWKVLRPRDASLLWDLVLVDADLATTSTKPLSHGGAGSNRAAAVFAGDRGRTDRSIRRQRDLAVEALREASDAFLGDFESGPAIGAGTATPRPDQLLQLTRQAQQARIARNARSRGRRSTTPATAGAAANPDRPTVSASPIVPSTAPSASDPKGRS